MMKTRVIINWGAYRRWYTSSVVGDWDFDERKPLYKHEKQDNDAFIYVHQGSLFAYMPKRFVLEETIENDPQTP